MSDSYTAGIPDDCIGKLMLYLTCVESVSDVSFGKLSKYQEYYLLTDSEKEQVYQLALQFSPKVFGQIGVFMFVDNSEINGKNNVYIDIRETKYKDLLKITLNIGTYRVKVSHLMLCTEESLKCIYAEPLAEYIVMKRNSNNTKESSYNYDTDSECGFGCNGDCMMCQCGCCDCDFTDCCPYCDDGCGWGPILVFILSIVIPIGFILLIIGCVEGKWRIRCCAFYGMVIGYFLFMYFILYW